ncbi:MAG: hypothetical protein JNL94_02475 [Planctomycetes bacterium]|nr:hypothetical protein [Planctomycetota bacterium]
MKSDRLLPATLRAALLGALVFFVFGALIDPARPGIAFVVGAFGALSAAIAVLLLAQFPVGPIGKLLLGLVCGPVFPVFVVLLAAHRGDKPGDHVGGAWFIGMLLGLFVGILEAYRTRRAQQQQDVL